MMIKTVPIGSAWRPVSMQPKSMNLGQAPLGPPPPPPAPEPFDPRILIFPAALLVGTALYAIFGHKKMTWDKLLY